MVRYLAGEQVVEGAVRARIRLDFKGVGKPGRFFIGAKPTEKVAEEIREQQVALLRNVPIQGVNIEDIDISAEVYTIYDEATNGQVAYAPVEILVAAESLDNLVKFVARDEFRKIEILEPANITLGKLDLERLLFRIGEEIKHLRGWLERKYNNR